MRSLVNGSLFVEKRGSNPTEGNSLSFLVQTDSTGVVWDKAGRAFPYC
jgi:hypothetical protein